MNKITNFIHNAIYTYDANKFMPIFVEGRLDNRGAYILYKAKRMLSTTAQGIALMVASFLTATLAAAKQ